MVELFELIAAKPLEFLAGLGISSATIYSIVRAIKGFIALITQKSRKAKELLQNNNIADAVVTKLGGVDAFVDKIADVVINKLTSSATMQEFKKILEKILTMGNCPIELKAYIQTVLTRSGDEQLKLLYEQIKGNLIAAASDVITEIIESGENKVMETTNNAPQEKIQTIEETANKGVEIIATVAKVANKKIKKHLNNEDDISYA